MLQLNGLWSRTSKIAIALTAVMCFNVGTASAAPKKSPPLPRSEEKANDSRRSERHHAPKESRDNEKSKKADSDDRSEKSERSEKTSKKSRDDRDSDDNKDTRDVKEAKASKHGTGRRAAVTKQKPSKHVAPESKSHGKKKAKLTPPAYAPLSRCRVGRTRRCRSRSLTVTERPSPRASSTFP